jgi:hypothetical protein
MMLEKAFDPQISPIYADKCRPCRARAYRRPGAPRTAAAALFHLRNLRHLRIELRFFA